MNKYIEKIAQLSDENRQALKTTAAVQAVGLPVHAAGTAGGAFLYGKLGLGQKLGGAAAALSKSRIKPLALLGKVSAPVLKSPVAGGFAGAAIAGAAGDFAAIKASLRKGQKPHEY